MSRRKSHSYIYNVQRIITLVFYTTTAIALSIPLVKFVSSLSNDSLFPLIATLIVYIILVVVLGSFFHVISYIPFHLAAAFDPIKNDVASGSIKDIDQLGKRVSRFAIDFFDFSFLDISHAFIQTEKSDLISYEAIEEIKTALGEFDMLEKSKQLKEIIRAGEISFHGEEYKLYILPIWFGERWLGYMGFLSRKRISHFFQRFLMEFEDNFLDDQVMHVIKCRKKK